MKPKIKTIPKRFKQIPGMGGCYYISRNGEIISKYRGRNTGSLITPVLVNGYYKICVYVRGVKSGAFVHRLLGITFIPNPNNYAQINHKDGNKGNNKLSNLEWVTSSMNQFHRFNVLKQESKYRKLTKDQLFSILSQPKTSVTTLRKAFNVSEGCIYSIRSGRTYKSMINEFKRLKNE